MKGLGQFRRLLPSQFGRKGGKHASLGRITTPPQRKLPTPPTRGNYETDGAGLASKPRGYKRRRRLAMEARRANVKRLRALKKR